LEGVDFPDPILLDPDNEPARPILNDLVPYTKQFNLWKGQLIFVITSGYRIGIGETLLQHIQSSEKFSENAQKNSCISH
jgi:hypothetical protein